MVNSKMHSNVAVLFGYIHPLSVSLLGSMSPTRKHLGMDKVKVGY